MSSFNLREYLMILCTVMNKSCSIYIYLFIYLFIIYYLFIYLFIIYLFIIYLFIY